jgi:hypothetical protein
MKITLVAIDLAKSVFQIVAIDEHRRVVFSRKVTREVVRSSAAVASWNGGGDGGLRQRTLDISRAFCGRRVTAALWQQIAPLTLKYPSVNEKKLSSPEGQYMSGLRKRF